MTDPKLREARIAEARVRASSGLNPPAYASREWHDAFANHLCDLIEQDWRPEPEVYAVTLAAREWLDRNQYATLLDIFRAGHAHALKTCADVRRMDWLEKQQNVTVDLLQPGGFLQCSGDADPLRTKIDRAMEGGE